MKPGNEKQNVAGWQERHLVIVNSVDAILWESDLRFGGFTFVSEQAERLLGYPVQRWLDEANFWAEHMHPEDREWCVDYCRDKTALGEDHDFEYRMIAADGRVVWLREVVNVVMEAGRPVALRGVMTDVTALKKAFSQLADREEQYRAVFEASSDGLVVSDAETGRVLAANPAFCRMHGWDDMTGFAPEAFIHPSSHYLFTDYLASIQEGRDFRCRARNIRRDGSILHVEVYGRGFVFQGKPAGLGVVRDVTEQMQAFELLEQRVTERTQEIERRREVAEGLRELLTVVNSERSLDEILAAVADQCRLLLKSDASSILMPLAGEEDVLSTRASSGMNGRYAGARLPLASTTVGLAFTNRRPAAVYDVPAAYAVAPRQSDGLPEFEDRGSHLQVRYLPPLGSGPRERQQQSFAASYRGFLAVPLVAREKAYGALTLNYHEPRPFSEEEIVLALAFADQASIAIENAGLHEQAAQQTREVERRRAVAEGLRDLLPVVNSGRPMAEILDAVAVQACRLLEGNACSIFLPSAESATMLTMEASHGIEEADTRSSLPVDGSATGIAFMRRRAVAVYDFSAVFQPAAASSVDGQDQPRFDEMETHLSVSYLPSPTDPRAAEQNEIFGRRFRGFLAVPLASKDRAYGVLNINYRQPRRFTEEEVALASAFADQAALALENARLYEQAQQAATLEERQRLARELHDAVTQTLFSTSLIAEVLPSLWETNQPVARQRLDDLRRLTRGALAEMRTLLLELRPGALTELPLSDLLKQLAEATAGRTHLEIALSVEGRPLSLLLPEVQVALYRIAQESFNNILRHAQAKRVEVRLKYELDETVSLEITDDGRGFDPSAVPGGHLGLGIMRERADAIGAMVSVDSSSGQGTKIHAIWPGSKGAQR